LTRSFAELDGHNPRSEKPVAGRRKATSKGRKAIREPESPRLRVESAADRLTPPMHFCGMIYPG
jgi:hypothetical protein